MILIILKRTILSHAPRMTNASDPHSTRTSPPSPDAPAPDARDGSALYLWLALVLAVGFAIVPTLFDIVTKYAGGEWFAGVDTYMRLVRVREWLGAENWSWYETFSARSNAPFGEVLHWTRPLDMVLSVLAAPFIPFVGLERALYFAGFIVSPVMFALALWATLWATRPLLDARGRVIIVVLFVCQPNAYYYFVAARPDHHAMILLCFATVLAFLARHSTAPERETRTITWAGVITALGIWVSVESLSIELFALLALGLTWMITGKAVWLDALRRFSFAGALTLIAALMVERPPAEWLTSEVFDRLSTAQVALLVLIALGIEGIHRVEPRLRARLSAPVASRFVAGALAAAGAGAAMHVLFPAFFKGPFGASMDSRLEGLWLSKVSEFQPLFGTDQDTTVEMIFFFIPLIWLAVWAFRALRERAPAPHTPYLVGTFLLAAALFAPLTAIQARWGAYMGIALLIPWTLLLIQVLDWRGGPMVGNKDGSQEGTPILRTPLFLAVAVGHILIGYATMALSEDGTKTSEEKSCHWPKIAPFLNSEQFAGGKPQTFANFIHAGPLILYYTHHRVVGTPYHRNTQGLLDTFTMLSSANIDESRAVFEARKVDFLLLCADTAEEHVMLDFDGDGVLRRIVDDRAPDWLRKSPLPDGLDAEFRLYRYVPQTP